MLRNSIIFCLILALTSCGAPTTVIRSSSQTEINEERLNMQRLAFNAYNERLEKLNNLAYPLIKYSLDFCPNNIKYDISYFNNDKSKIVKKITKISENKIYSHTTIIYFSDFQLDVVNDNKLINVINSSNTTNTIFFKNIEDINNLSISDVTLDKSIIIPNEVVSINSTITNNTSNKTLKEEWEKIVM